MTKTLAPRNVTLMRSWRARSLLAPASPADPVAEHRWAKTLDLVRETFPDVPQLSTQRLADLLGEGAQVVLLDARTNKEFRISHLRGAVQANDLQSATRVLNKGSEDRTIVVYCSVGYRSSGLAEQLRTHGVKNVFNLEGSIFKWANEGRPVYRRSERVQEVHPFDEDWGELLDKSLHTR